MEQVVLENPFVVGKYLSDKYSPRQTMPIVSTTISSPNGWREFISYLTYSAKLVGIMAPLFFT